jgi:hypothetical protein
MASLYQRLTDAGVTVSNWQSDLYFPVTEQTRAIVAQCLADGELKSKPSVFKSNDSGLPTFEAPFMFDPFWQNRSK